MPGQISNLLTKIFPEVTPREGQSSHQLGMRLVVSVIGSTVILYIENFQHSSSVEIVGSEILLAGVIYLGCGAPLHRLASNEMARKRIGALTFMSLSSSALFWFSFAIAVGWIFFPRLFPTRWLEQDLSLRTFFPHASAVIIVGLLEMMRRQRRSPKED